MKKFYNNNPNFGDAGPHKAKSMEALADEMHENFSIWADDELHFLDSDYMGTIPTREKLIAKMRKEFIAGLEECEG